MQNKAMQQLFSSISSSSPRTTSEKGGGAGKESASSSDLLGHHHSESRASVPRAVAANLRGKITSKLDVARTDLALVKNAPEAASAAKPDQTLVMEQCRLFSREFQEQLNSVEIASRIRRSFGGGTDGLRHRLRMIDLTSAFEQTRVDSMLRQGDGYQPHLVSPEAGLRLLMADVLEQARIPAEQCVRDVHALLQSAAKAACDDAMYTATPPNALLSESVKEQSALNIHQCHALLTQSADSALSRWREEAIKAVSTIISMEQSHVSAKYFRHVTEAAALEAAAARSRREVSRSGTNETNASDTTTTSSTTTSAPSTSRTTPPTADANKARDSRLPSSSKDRALDIDMEYLEKQNKHGVWQRRWFVLDTSRNCLFYYKEDKEHHSAPPRGRIDLLDAIVTDMKVSAGSPQSRDSRMAVDMGVGEEPVSLLLGISNKEKGKPVWKDHPTVVLRCPSIETKFEWFAKLRSATSIESGRRAALLARGGGGGNSTTDMAMENKESDSEDDEVASTVGEDITVTYHSNAPPPTALQAHEAAVRLNAYVDVTLGSLSSAIPKAVVHLMVRRAERELVDRLYKSVFDLSPRALARLFTANQHEVDAANERISQLESTVAELESATEWLSRHSTEIETGPGQASVVFVPRHVLTAAGMSPRDISPREGMMEETKKTSSQQQQQQPPPVPPRKPNGGGRRAPPPPPPSAA